MIGTMTRWSGPPAPKSILDAFIAFLEALLITHYPTGRCVLVLDNASYHTSAASLAALSLFEHRGLVFWLPKYCSLELNAIERFWRHLKDMICVDTLLPALAQLVTAVEAQLCRQNHRSELKCFAFLKNNSLLLNRTVLSGFNFVSTKAGKIKVKLSFAFAAHQAVE